MTDTKERPIRGAHSKARPYATARRGTVEIGGELPPRESLGAWHDGMSERSVCSCRHVLGSHGSQSARCCVEWCPCDVFRPSAVLS